jgi:hypothetical protein
VTVGVVALSRPKILETDQLESQLQLSVCVDRLIAEFVHSLNHFRKMLLGFVKIPGHGRLTFLSFMV